MQISIALEDSDRSALACLLNDIGNRKVAVHDAERELRRAEDRLNGGILVLARMRGAPDGNVRVAPDGRSLIVEVPDGSR